MTRDEARDILNRYELGLLTLTERKKLVDAIAIAVLRNALVAASDDPLKALPSVAQMGIGGPNGK